MDMITESLLSEFSREREIESLAKDKRFEHFAAYITVRRQHSETFDTSDIVMGGGGDTGIDGFAAIVNSVLVADANEFEDIASTASNLDVVFVFIQAEQSPSFDGAKILTFGYGVLDFFSDLPKLHRSDAIQGAADLMRAIYAKSSKFKRDNPACKLYYVTTGKWNEDQNLVARRDTLTHDLLALNLFESVDFYPVGADGIQKLYRQAKNAISREFVFANKAVVPSIEGVTEAYLGLIPANELLAVLTDDDGDITKSIFYDNVRDWQDFNEVNLEIQETLTGPNASRFALMNNGITIITRHLIPTGNKFHIEDFQIVNGCQTSHVLFEVAKDRGKFDPSVMVPLRMIASQDEDVINAIIRATNRQTQVKEEQFFALTEFPKQLEQFFVTFPESRKLYYERRSRQFDSLPIEKTRIVTQVGLTRAFAGMFLNEAHRVTRNYKSIVAKIGKDIFGKNHKLQPYYTAAYALYKLEFLFRTHRVDSLYKPARFHLLLALRLFVGKTSNMPLMNSHAMEDYCQKILDVLWDPVVSDLAFSNAVEIIENAAQGQFHRDVIRTEGFTEKVLEAARDFK